MTDLIVFLMVINNFFFFIIMGDNMMFRWAPLHNNICPLRNISFIDKIKMVSNFKFKNLSNEGI